MEKRRRGGAPCGAACERQPEIACGGTPQRRTRASFPLVVRCIVDAVSSAVRGDIPCHPRRNIDSAQMPSYQGTAFNLVR